MRLILATGAAVALLVLPAYAQWLPVGKTSHWGSPVGEPMGQRHKGRGLFEKVPKPLDERAERAYRSVSDRIPAKKANPDPWHSVRDPQPK